MSNLQTWNLSIFQIKRYIIDVNATEISDAHKNINYEVG